MKKIKIILFGVLIIFYLVSFFIGSNKSSAASYLYFTLFLNYLFNLPCLGLCLFILILVIKKIRAGKRELINEELTKKARNRIESGRKTDKKGLLACLIAITIMVPVFLMDYDHILDYKNLKEKDFETITGIVKDVGSSRNLKSRGQSIYIKSPSGESVTLNNYSYYFDSDLTGKVVTFDYLPRSRYILGIRGDF